MPRTRSPPFPRVCGRPRWADTRARTRNATAPVPCSRTTPAPPRPACPPYALTGVPAGLWPARWEVVLRLRASRFYPAGRQARLTAIWRGQVFRSRHAALPPAWWHPWGPSDQEPPPKQTPAISSAEGNGCAASTTRGVRPRLARALVAGGGLADQGGFEGLAHGF